MTHRNSRSIVRCSSLLFSFIALSVSAKAFELTSPDVKPNQPIPEKFTFNGLGCKGENLSPALQWKNPPEGTKSFALMVHDRDAETGGAGIWHWVVVNIPPTATELEQGAGDGRRRQTAGRQPAISNDYAGLAGSPGWGGPCPPQGPQGASLQLHFVRAQGRQAGLQASGHGFAIRLLRKSQFAGQGTAYATYGRAD